MANEFQLEACRALRSAQDKYSYFLLAGVGAAIGFAVTQTKDAALAWSQLPLGAAVLCWGVSFFCGCRHLQYVSQNLYANTELFQVQAGAHPLAGTHPEAIRGASEGIRSAMENNNNKSMRYAEWQFSLLVIGAVLYVAWHALEMYLRVKSLR